MGYHYDPILCMNVPDGTSKAKDASWKAWTLYIDGKWVKSFNSSMAPIKEAQKFMKENYPGKVGKLVRNTGSSSGYSISGSEHKDAACNSLDKAIDENYIVSGMKSQLGQMLKRYKDPKNRNQLVSQYIGIVNNHRANGKVTEEEFNEFVKYAKGLVGGSHDALDRAIRTADKFTVWESDEYDDIYVSYEGGTYVLYVDGRPQADGPQQRMIQLAKQEERMRD